MELARQHRPAPERRDETNAMPGPGCDAVPTEVWDSHVGGKPAADSGDEAQPLRAGRFLAPLAQHLHPETNAEQRRAAGCGVANRAVETAVPERGHPRSKRPDSRQDDP